MIEPVGVLQLDFVDAYLVGASTGKIDIAALQRAAEQARTGEGRSAVGASLAT